MCIKKMRLIVLGVVGCFFRFNIDSKFIRLGLIDIGVLRIFNGN